MNTPFLAPTLLRVTDSKAPHSTGFTLVELMVTVAIVAILAAIGYPSYRNYVIRGQLVDATNGLSALRANMERYYQDNRTYDVVGAINPPCIGASNSGNFALSCSVHTATAYTLQAQGATSGSALYGFVFTVDQNNTQTTVVTTPPAPSAFLGCTNAWITKTGGC